MSPLSRSEAVSRLSAQIDAADGLKTLRHENKQFTKWRRDTSVLVARLFGEDSSQAEDLSGVDYTLLAWSSGVPESAWQEAYIDGLETAQQILRSLITEIEAFGLPTGPGKAAEKPGQEAGRPIEVEKLTVKRLAQALGNLTLPSAVLLGGLFVSALGTAYELGRRSAPSPTSDLSAASGLGSPADGQAGILIDLSHRQIEWDSFFTVFDPDEGPLVEAARRYGRSRVQVATVTDPRQFLHADFAEWEGLVLGMPFHDSLTAPVIDRIDAWVQDGGRLLLLGYELGDRHHVSNLNALAVRFGLTGASNIVAPSFWEQVDVKPYWDTIAFSTDAGSEHRVLRGLDTVSMRGASTVGGDPGTLTLLSVGHHKIAELLPSAVRYRNRILDVPDYAAALGRDSVAAVWVAAPPGLTGAGEVLMVGTWDVEPGSEVRRATLYDNLVAWLAGA